MNEFTPARQGFTYKIGSRILKGTIAVSSSNFLAAQQGDPAAKRIVLSDIGRELRMQDCGFMSKVSWNKIKWIAE